MSTLISANVNTTASLAMGATAYDGLDFFGDADWYRVYLSAGFSYQIFLNGRSSTSGSLADPNLTIYNASGVFLASNDDVSFFESNSYLNFAPSTTGNHFFSVSEFGNNATGTYQISVFKDQLASVGSAASIAVNTMLTDIIGYRDDNSDWYRISLTSGISYQFDLQPSSANGSDQSLNDPFLFLRDSAGNFLLANDDSGDGLSSRIFFTPTASGTYFLDVQESGVNAAGTYALIANRAPVSGRLAIGSSVNGEIAFFGDTNLYSLTLTAGVAYGFSISSGSELDPFLEIDNQSGHSLISDNDSGVGLNSLTTFTPLATGTYYLGATAFGNASIGSYSTSAWVLPTISVSDAQVFEEDHGSSSLDFIVSLSAPSPVDVAVTVGTLGSTASNASGDYNGVFARTLIITAGELQTTFSITVNPDDVFEPNEGFRVVLSNPSMAILGDGEARGWIFDDDAPYALPDDFLLRYQWYLYPDTGVNVFPVWESSRGAGVTVAVFDQGIDSNHLDLDGNLLLDAGRRAFNLGLGGAPVLASDNHGTAVAGVIAAESNGLLGVGLAPEANLVSIYSPLSTERGLSSFANEIENAYSYAVRFDVLNDSWGFGNLSVEGADFAWAFLDNFKDSVFKGAGVALKQLADLGRDGLGTVVVQSAGNNSGYGDDTNLHNFQNSRYIITVAGTNYSGGVTSYSSPGASVLVAAPGGDGSDDLGQIYTTDRTGVAGYATGDYKAIIGTSFSAPVVSGVVALMLDANSDLGYRDVQQILAYTARKTAVQTNDWKYNGASNWNGRGLHYDSASHDLGYGLVDALAAVRLAESWNRPAATSANDLEISSTKTVVQTIPDGRSLIQQNIQITTPIEVERVEVTIDIEHSFIGDLSILLTSPSGTSSFLLYRPGQGALSAFGQTQNNIDFTFNTVLSMGESGLGTWTLAVFDLEYGYVGKLNSWTLNLIGKPESGDDIYVYTNEFSESVVDQNIRETLNDTDGIDTLNASAVTAAMSIDLTPGSRSVIDGRSLTISNSTTIEDAVGGDGGDVLQGNSVENNLRGMRGDDTLFGGAGNDWLDGGSGLDVALFSGLRSDYKVRWDATNNCLDVRSETEGFDRLLGIETIKFSDVSYEISVFQTPSAPTLTTISMLTGGREDTAYTINYAALAAAADEAEAAGNPLSFSIETVSSGTLTKGGISVTAGTATLASGESLVWTPALNANGVLTALTVKTTDGMRTSATAIPVKVQVAPVNDAGSVAINGTAVQAQALSAIVSDPDSVVGAVSYVWKAGTGTLGTGSSYIPGAADVGKAVTVTATYTDGGGTLQSVTSTVTEAILNGQSQGSTANDTLMGGYGADSLRGLSGNDVYYANHTSDVVVEALGKGVDTVYSFLSSYTLGANIENGRIMLNEGARLLGNGAGNLLFAGAGNDTLDGMAGIDTVSYEFGLPTVATSGVNVSLATATTQATGASGSDVLINIENLTGTGKNDFLTGSSAKNLLDGGAGHDTLSGGGGDDTLLGGNGNDLLIGGLGKDSLSGGAGSDIFDFNALTEMGTNSSTGDVISDFVSGIDKIDLLSLDANTATTKNDAFSGNFLLGSARFSAPGQLKFNNGVLYGNTDADIDPEFAISLTGVTLPLVSSDFVL